MATTKIIDTKTESTIYKTSAEQKEKIAEGINQIESGEYFADEQIESEINKWLAA